MFVKAKTLQTSLPHIAKDRSYTVSILITRIFLSKIQLKTNIKSSTVNSSVLPRPFADSSSHTFKSSLKGLTTPCFF